MADKDNKWVTFAELLALPDVVALANQMFPDDTAPGHQELFTAATTVLLGVLPEGDLGPGTALTAACVFYVADAEDSATYRPWTLQVGLGASAWYTFTALEDDPVHNECDSEPWHASTMQMLGRSLWLPVQPAGLG